MAIVLRAGLPVVTFEGMDKHPGVTCFVTTRAGGTSVPPYDSLNLGRGTDDDPNAVAQNRARVAAALGVEGSALTLGSQVHGVAVAVVGDADAGRVFAATDALITNVPGLPLGVLVADCVPIILYDAARSVIGVAHAGWRGTLAGIATETVRAMHAAYGTDPGDVMAAIGPSIGPCCYEVGPEVVDAFYERQPEFAPDVLSAPDFASAGSFEGGVNTGRMMLDLWEMNARLMAAAGVREDHIEVAEMCTSCQTERFFSHRAENGRTGRFAAVVCLARERR